MSVLPSSHSSSSSWSPSTSTRSPSLSPSLPPSPSPSPYPSSPPKLSAPSSSPTSIYNPSSGEDFDFPHTVLQSDRLRVTVFLPDAERGYYRASRFEWSSMIGAITLDEGTHFLDDWRKPHNPMIPEHGIGFAEEFGMADPPGFRAKKGSQFLKIGVGVCENNASAPYNFNAPYRVVVPGQWSIDTTQSSVQMRSKVVLGDHGYDYQKDLSIDGTTLTIHHTLRNIGKKAISTWTYSHNFFNRPHESTGSNYTFKMPIPIAPEDFKGCSEDAIEPVNRQSNASVDPSTSTFRFTRNLNSSDVFYCDFGTVGADRSGRPFRNSFSVEDSRGYGFHKTGTEPLQTLHFYAVDTAVAVEPFSHIHLNPGEETSWTHKVTFISPVDQDLIPESPMFYVISIITMMLLALFLGFVVKGIVSRLLQKKARPALASQEVISYEEDIEKKRSEEDVLNTEAVKQRSYSASSSSKRHNYGSCIGR